MLEDCPRVADFFQELVSTVSSFSFQLNPDDTLTLDPEVNIHPYEGMLETCSTQTEICKERLSDLKGQFSSFWVEVLSDRMKCNMACIIRFSQNAELLISNLYCQFNINSSNPGSGYSHSKNCVSTAGFSAIILGPCSSEHNKRRLTLALVYMVIDLCVLSRNEKAKFA